MSRLFTFGCSFTQFHWPTWANILGKEFDYFENWGRCGAGNQYIFNALIECNLQHSLTVNDTVIIMWSNVCREDRYVNRAWLTPGNIFTQSTYNKNFVKDFADIRGYYLRDLATIWSVDQILKNIGCRYVFLSIVDIDQPLQYELVDNNIEYSDLLKKYHLTLKKIRPSVHQVIFNYDWTSRRPNSTIVNYTQSLDRIINNYWTAFYSRIKDSLWPNIKTYKDFSLLPSHIQTECIEVFGWDLSKIEKQAKDSLKQLYNVKSDMRNDAHPTPLEHLKYLDEILPEFDISDSTRKWANSVELRLQEGQPFYDDLFFNEHLAARW